MKITDIYYLSSTHWDREWYQTFQGFRQRLVKMTDELIDYIENEPEFGVFHFDGQTIVLEDYTEIAPDNKDRLKKLIGDGKIKIGPWYDMPDEFLLSGESLIRNLMTGAKLSKQWGAEPWGVGYICDIFGHIAQTPQIFNGFGLKYTILGRGTNEDDEAFFVWQSPDGSNCIGFRLQPEGGYGVMNVVTKAENDEQLRKQIKEHIDSEAERSNSPVLILMDGHDHTHVNKKIPKILKMIKELYPDVNVHQCDVSEAGKQLEKYRDNLPVTIGELNKTSIDKHPYLHLITNTLSSYYTHKKANDECQNLLEKIIEPMYAYQKVNGGMQRRTYLELAYKNLLQNHPHDSICGCSIEQVHKDMVYRFDQVKEIAAILEEDFLYNNRPAAGDSSNYILKLYNPLPFERKETIKAEIILKNNFPTKYEEPFGYEFINSFKLTDKEGNEIPYGVSKIIRNYKKRVYELNEEHGELYSIIFEADMPACGYCEYKLVPYEKPSRYLEKMKSGSNYAENEYVRLEITDNGEISILDKKTNKEYKNLCGFIDDGEIGDGWYHANPANDITVYSHGTGARIEKLESAPSRCVFKISKLLEVPEKIEDLATGKRRSNKYIKIPIEIEVGLSKNSRFADVNIKVTNIAKDHRLRLSLPTGVDGQMYFAGQTYYCNERKTGIDYRTQNWREHEQYEKQMNGIVGKRLADASGIAFVSANGLHECAAFEDGNIFVTLLRAFRTTVSTMGEDGGQLLKDLSYSFLLVPLDESVTYSELVKLQDRLAIKPIMSSSEVKEDYLPKNQSFMRIDGDNLNLSIVKPSEDGADNTIVVRVYNASNEKADGKIVFDRNISKVFEVNFNEENADEAKANGNELPISLSKWKVQTYKISF